jgi:hypothetical protein
MSCYSIVIMKKAIIYVPGLNDDKLLNKKLINFLPLIWNKYGYDVFIVRPEWRKGKSFYPKLTLIINKIDELSSKGYTIYLFGQSAGGAAVLNAYTERKHKIKKVVNICGRLRKDKNVLPSAKTTADENSAFAESMLLFENLNEKRLTMNDRKKVLTIRPIWDGVVPSSTVELQGATNITIPMIQHSIAGISALTIFSHEILSFLSS